VKRGVVVDSSAILALLGRESGWEHLRTRIAGAAISTVNVAEIHTKLAEQGATREDSEDIVAGLQLKIMPFDVALAVQTGWLRPATLSAGLSLGDRACLVLARSLDAVALTTDRAWAKVAVGVTVELIR